MTATMTNDAAVPTNLDRHRNHHHRRRHHHLGREWGEVQLDS